MSNGKYMSDEEIVDQWDARLLDLGVGAAAAAEPVADPGTGEEAEQPLTLGGLRNALAAYLPAALNEAKLYINGRPVLDIDAIEITRPDDVFRVNLTIRGAG